uniref:Uncharacterized protein n=1 Tax=Oryza sativa subsp. japonica TaxID=39947 RepID=Q6Z3V1_ORYSJ|nr:hypothetical protein [Oryza sativa Japonica Group]
MWGPHVRAVFLLRPPPRKSPNPSAVSRADFAQIRARFLRLVEGFAAAAGHLRSRRAAASVVAAARRCRQEERRRVRKLGRPFFSAADHRSPLDAVDPNRRAAFSRRRPPSCIL